MRHPSLTVSTAAGVVALTGLLLASPTADAAELQEGPWRAWLDCPGGEMPFGLEFRTDDDGLHAWIRNGDERLPVPELRWEGQELVFVIEHFETSLRATLNDAGTRLDGEWHRQMGSNIWHALPFHATAGAAPRFPPEPPPVQGTQDSPAFSPLEARWSAKFEARSNPSVALFETSPDGSVQGTFLHLQGDYRYLAGSFEHGRLRLSRFDGAHAFLFDARRQDDGTLAGTFWEANYYEDEWTARPDPKAQLRDPFAFLKVEDPDLSSLVFFDLSGKPCLLTDVWSPGKPLIIEILGTWCPNCHDASKFLMELRDEYGPEKLAIVGLAFEMLTDFGRNSKKLRRYGKRHGIEYPLLLASIGAPVAPTEFFKPLTGEFAFPTILFFDSHGAAHAAYTGFSGPATGEEHERMKARWRAVIEDLLAAAG